MSAKGRTIDGEAPPEADALERCYTPDLLAVALVRAILPTLFPEPSWWPHLRVLESGCGGGAFVRAFQDVQVTVDGLDIDPRAAGLRDVIQGGGVASVRSFLDVPGNLPSGYPYHLVMGNPPFSLAEAFVRHALTLAPFVCYVLPTTFMGSATRRRFFLDHPPIADNVVLERPTFREDGRTDATTYHGLVWARASLARGVWVGRHVFAPDDPTRASWGHFSAG